MPDVWETIQELAQQGKAPRLTVSEANRLLTPKQKRGRPRVVDPKSPFKHYATVTGKHQARCMNRGCQKHLRKDQHGGCSDHCVDQIIDHAITLLRAVGLTKKELMHLYPDVE